jgi:steroid delta-isomerase-like uncharacterized protein
MSAENKHIVQRWFEEVWNQGRVETIDELFAPHGVAHGLGDDIHGPAGFKPFHAAFRQAFPNIRIVVDQLIAEGDRVAYSWTAEGTHQGQLMGIAPTGRASRFEGMGIVRVQNGQIVEGWNVFDQLTMFQQIGALQRPA